MLQALSEIFSLSCSKRCSIVRIRLRVSKGYENALLLVAKTIDKVMTGELELKDLIVSNILRQDLYKYRNLFPHVSAALQLTEAGVPLKRGALLHLHGCGSIQSSPKGDPHRIYRGRKRSSLRQGKISWDASGSCGNCAWLFRLRQDTIWRYWSQQKQKVVASAQGAATERHRNWKVFKHLILLSPLEISAVGIFQKDVLVGVVLELTLSSNTRMG